MQRMVTLIVLAMAFAGMFILGRVSRYSEKVDLIDRVSSAPAEGGCSEATLKGKWGFSSEGKVVGFDAIVHFASIGLFNYDGSGAFSGSETLNMTREIRESYRGKVPVENENPDTPGITRTIRERSFTGTYTVKSDCTGFLTVRYDNGDPQVRANFVIVRGGNECLFISRDKAAATGIAKRQ